MALISNDAWQALALKTRSYHIPLSSPISEGPRLTGPSRAGLPLH